MMASVFRATTIRRWRREARHDLVGLASRFLTLFCWITRQEGFEGFTMTYWRWRAIITLAFRERAMRRSAERTGQVYRQGPVYGEVYLNGQWVLSPAGGSITRTGQISPLYYEKIRGGLPVLKDVSFTPGNILFVDSGATSRGSDGAGYGTHPDTPVLTLDYAVGLTTASQADFIFVLPGHYEDLGAAETVDLDVQGISVIGIGNGPDRPEFVYDATDAEIDIGASGIHVSNLLLQPSIAATVVGIDIETTVTDTFLEDIEGIPGEAGDGTDEFVDFITLAATCTRTHIKGLLYSHHASCDASQTAISLTDASDRVHIEDFWIEGSGAGWVAGIQGLATLSTRILIENGTITCDAEPGIELLTGTTGTIRDVRIFSDLATIDAACVADGCAHFNVEYVEVGDEAGTMVKTASVDD